MTTYAAYIATRLFPHSPKLDRRLKNNVPARSHKGALIKIMEDEFNIKLSGLLVKCDDSRQRDFSIEKVNRREFSREFYYRFKSPIERMRFDIELSEKLPSYKQVHTIPKYA